jgi:hypothetical protein
MTNEIESVGQELIKSLEDFGVMLSDEDKDNILVKAKEQEDKKKAEEDSKPEKEVKKEESTEDEGKEDEDIEKAYSKAKTEYEEMEKCIAGKKKAMEDLGSKLNKSVNKGIDEDLVKEQSELIKSLSDEIGSLKEKINDSSKNDSLLNEISELKKAIDEIGNQRQGMRSVKNVNFIEKGGAVEDEEGKAVLSVSSQKGKVLDVLEKAMDSSTDIEKKEMYKNTILSFNMGGVPISSEVAADLFKGHGVRLAK